MKSRLYLSVILIGLFFSVCEKGKAQSPAWLWAKNALGAGSEEGSSTTTDANGNVLVTGSFQSPSITFGAITLTSAGFADFYIVKYDASGNVLWAKSAGGTSTEVGKSVCTDTSGNVLVTGYFTSSSITFGTITLTNTGLLSSDIFIVKYDASGNVLWAKSEGQTSEDKGYGIACDATGNVMVTGDFETYSITIGTTTLTNSGGHDIFVVKYDTSGNVIWAKSAVGFGNEDGYSISTDTGGNVLVTGYYQSANLSFGTTTLTNNGGSNIFVVKYDASGNALWATSAGGDLADIGTGIAADASGNVLVTGYSLSDSITFGTTTLNNAGIEDIFVVKYDATGNMLWAKSEGGANEDDGHGISTDASGNVLATGYFKSPSITFGTTTLTSAGNSDIYIVKYDTSGNVLWAKSAGGFTEDKGIAIAADASGNALVTGSFYSPSITFGTTTLTNAGIYDIFVSKIALCMTTATVNAVACDSFTSPSGNYNWTTSGIYLDTLTNGAGCDSIITINLTIHTVDTSITQSGIILTSNAIVATYQWLDCDSGYAPINGATSQVFTPLVDGNYAVAVTQNGCTDTSSCYSVTGVGINEVNPGLGLNVYPNPVSDVLYVSLNKPLPVNIMITISDMQGRIVGEKNTNHTHDSNGMVIPINVSALTQGVYLLRVDGAVRRFVKM